MVIFSAPTSVCFPPWLLLASKLLMYMPIRLLLYRSLLLCHHVVTFSLFHTGEVWLLDINSKRKNQVKCKAKIPELKCSMLETIKSFAAPLEKAKVPIFCMQINRDTWGLPFPVLFLFSLLLLGIEWGERTSEKEHGNIVPVFSGCLYGGPAASSDEALCCFFVCLFHLSHFDMCQSNILCGVLQTKENRGSCGGLAPLCFWSLSPSLERSLAWLICRWTRLWIVASKLGALQVVKNRLEQPSDQSLPVYFNVAPPYVSLLASVIEALSWVLHHTSFPTSPIKRLCRKSILCCSHTV